MEGQQLGQHRPPLAPGDDLVQKAVVCSLTLGPAKPMRAPGSASMMSPSEAKLAVTPPVVGWVKQEIYSPPRL